MLRPAEGVAVRPCGWTHGESQHLNLLWRSGRVHADSCDHYLYPAWTDYRDDVVAAFTAGPTPVPVRQ
ncbi:hypothetical protein Vau01_022380 [Virgisporangium aurantiacum]|uniref:Uncharacterized protein n=1 Tax=Virgisporangium aurantiacum TaxID=175570 RepID=A0A8J3Z1E0_9ACTN|nr:hypothetical protein Vau01_022380 [Virgisporangium aurantiacum]